MKQSMCHECGYLGAPVPTDGVRRPSPGEYCLCINCGALGVFGADLTTRRMTQEEAAELPPDMVRSVANARRYIALRGPLKQDEHHA